MKTKRISLAPSSAKTWMKCGGSLKIKSARSPFIEKREAERGTAIHKLAANTLRKLFKIKSKIELFTPTEKQIYLKEKAIIDEYVQFYIDTVTADYAVLGPEAKIFVEPMFRMPTKQYIFQGAPDCYIIKDDLILLYDLKTGWVEIEADGDEQLFTYLHMIAKAHKLKNPRMQGAIIQTPLKQIWRANFEFDSEFFEEINIDLDKFVVGSHCYNCNAKQVCKKFVGEMKNYMRPEMRDDTHSRHEVWAEFLDISRSAEKFFKEARSEASKYLQLGGKIPGWTIGEQMGRRTWKQGMNARALSKQLNLEINQCMHETLETPAKIEESLKREGKPVQDLESLYYIPRVPILKKLNDNSNLMKKRATSEQSEAALEQKVMFGEESPYFDQPNKKLRLIRKKAK